MQIQMKISYTEEQLQRALNFINERLSLQRSSIKEVNSIIKKASESIVKISYKYKIEPRMFQFSSNKKLNFEVDEILSNLLDDLFETISNYCFYNIEKREDKILVNSMLNEKFKGANIEERLNNYVARFKNEIEPIIAAALYLGFNSRKTSEYINRYITNLRNSKLANIAKKESFVSNSNNNISTGRGYSKSSYKNIERIVIDYVARIRQKLFIKKEETEYKTNAWYVMRGSSYPCGLCDSEVGIHSSDIDLPPYHPRCCCLAIPIKIDKI